MFSFARFLIVACSFALMATGLSKAQAVEFSPTPVKLSPTPVKEAWRYTLHNGEWWYWMPQNRWVFWRNNQWNGFTPRPSAPPAGFDRMMDIPARSIYSGPASRYLGGDEVGPFYGHAMSRSY